MTSTARPAAPVEPLPSARLAGLTIAHADIELSAPTGTLRPESTVSDAGKVLALVRLVGPEQGPPAAVLKLARSALGATELRTQRRVLTELAIHLELDEEWRELLPRILVFDERTDATVSVESYRPGIDLAEVLARRPTRVEELTAAALSAIAPLHRRTATFVVVDNVCLLRRWVNEPLAELTDMCRRLDPRPGFRGGPARNDAAAGPPWPAYAGELDARRLHPPQRSGGRHTGPGHRHRRLGRGAARPAGADRRVPDDPDGELPGRTG